MEPPYSVPEPRQLTERLRQQWLRVQAQNRHLRRVSHRPDPAHVNPNVPSTHNTGCHSMQNGLAGPAKRHGPRPISSLPEGPCT
jgi:hypothetical protein